MQVTLNKGRVHSIEIFGGFTGPYINLELSPTVAYELLLALSAKREEIRDMATNYYDCRECAQTHPKTMRVCPNISEEGE